MPSFNIKDKEAYNKYKNYFDKIIDYINQNKDIFNESDLYFAKSVADTSTYEE